MTSLLENSMKPMLACLTTEVFDSPQHVYEAKWSGVRCLAYLSTGQTRLVDRRGRDVSCRYPELLQLHRQLAAPEAILDGEIIVPVKGRPDARALQYREEESEPASRLDLARRLPAIYVAFDCVVMGGKMVTHLPLLERKDTLRRLVKQGRQLVLGTWVGERGTDFFHQISKLGLDGMVAKEKSSRYLPGQRSRQWLKVVKTRVQDCVVCGFTEGQGRRAGLLGSLVLGVHSPSGLIHVGQVGSGFDDETLAELHRALVAGESDCCPFDAEPRIDRPTTWLRPEAVAEVQYTEWSPDLKLRGPRFVRLREDKSPAECDVEELDLVMVPTTSPSADHTAVCVRSV